MNNGLHLEFFSEGTEETNGWYVLDRDGGALAGPFDMKDEALSELEAALLSERSAASPA
jgi:hypothetical protein